MRNGSRAAARAPAGSQQGKHPLSVGCGSNQGGSGSEATRRNGMAAAVSQSLPASRSVRPQHPHFFPKPPPDPPSRRVPSRH